ncbi:MAG TPA: hypothetical protein VIT44_19410 [Cyclobacteriaceae bacterium]
MKSFMLAALLLAGSLSLFAQKDASKPMLILFTIEPSDKLPDNLLKYKSVLRTPLDPLTLDDEVLIKAGTTSSSDKRQTELQNARNAKFTELEKTYLGLSVPKRTAVTSGEDFLITLETSDVKVTFTNPVPLSDLKMEDDIFRYTFSATLTVKDNSGNVLLEKKLANPEEEQKLTKAVVFFNPVYKLKISMAKNNPEKMKKLSDQLLEKKNHLVLEQTLAKADKALADAYETQSKRADVAVFSVKGKPYAELGELSDKIFETYMKFGALSKKNRLPKESVDQVWKDAIPVWEKYMTEHKAEMEDKASKGLQLNCGLAYSWLGEFDKAAPYLDAVPEAKRSEDDVKDMMNGPSTSMAPTIQSFKSYAINIRDLYEVFKEYKGRIVITQ